MGPLNSARRPLPQDLSEAMGCIVDPQYATEEQPLPGSQDHVLGNVTRRLWMHNRWSSEARGTGHISGGPSPVCSPPYARSALGTLGNGSVSVGAGDGGGICGKWSCWSRWFVGERSLL